MHLREISQGLTQLIFCIIGWKIIILKLLPHPAGDNELKTLPCSRSNVWQDHPPLVLQIILSNQWFYAKPFATHANCLVFEICTHALRPLETHTCISEMSHHRLDCRNKFQSNHKYLLSKNCAENSLLVETAILCSYIERCGFYSKVKI